MDWIPTGFKVYFVICFLLGIAAITGIIYVAIRVMAHFGI